MSSKKPLENPQYSFTPPMMLLATSGHINFDLIGPLHLPTVPTQQISADQARVIQQQTNEAIKVATESDNATNNNNKNSK